MEDGTLGAAAFYNEATVDPALKLVPGHLLTHINDADLQNVAYTEVLDRVEAAERPIKLGFMAPPNRFDSALRLRRQSSVSHPPPTKEASSVAFRVFNAIQYGHFLSVLELQTKIDFNWKYPTDQRNLLHFAARYKEINATKWLLRRENGRALVQERSIQGRYPMHDAISGGNLAISTQIYELFPQAIHEGDAKALRTLQDPNPQGYFLSVNLAEIRHLPGENAATRYFIVVKIAPGMTYRSKLGTLQEKFALDTQSFRHPKFDFKVPVLDAFQSIDVDIFAVQNLESTLLTSFSCNISAKDGIQWVPLNCQGQGEALVITNDDEIQEITDAFGFQLPSSHLKRYVVASRLAKCVETYHELSWKRLVDQILQNELDIESRCEMEALIWNGVPAAWRSTVYFFASGAAALQSQHESTYYLSLEAKFDSSPDKKLIDADVKRTFADQPFMETSRPALERVLLAFTVHMPDVGYCQSMNFIAARLLVVLPEEQTFWVLVILCGQKFSKYYLRTLQGVHVDGSVLEALMQSRLPRLIHHCHLLDTPVEILAAQWFLPLFCQTFPASTTFRLLDCILVHDSSVVFALVLAHLRLASPGLLKTKDYMAFTNSLRQLEAGLYDVEHLLEMAAKEFHSLHVAVHQLRETQTHIENAKIENENPIQESSPHNSSFHKETNEAEPRIST
ncbi:unnamed protein product [Aphanomyces euteiches]